MSGDIKDLPVIAAASVHEGAAVGDNGSGYFRPLVAGDMFGGFALEKVDNAAGAAGAKQIRVQRKGRQALAVSGAVVGDIGRLVYASDDDTFTFTAGNNTVIGPVTRFVSSGVVDVAFDVDKQPSLVTVAMTVGAEAADVITVAGQVKPERARCLRWYLSDDAAGNSLASSAPDGGVAAGTDGVIEETTADKAGFVTTEADGDFDLAITHAATGGDTFYLVLVMPDGSLRISGAITFA